MTYDLKASNAIYTLVLFYVSFVCHSHVVCMQSYVIGMSMQFNFVLHAVLCYLYVLLCDSYGIRMSLVYHTYVTRMHSHVIHMPSECHPYVTRMYSHVIGMSLVYIHTKYGLINKGTDTVSIKPVKVKVVQLFNKSVLLKTLSFCFLCCSSL